MLQAFYCLRPRRKFSLVVNQIETPQNKQKNFNFKNVTFQHVIFFRRKKEEKKTPAFINYRVLFFHLIKRSTCVQASTVLTGEALTDVVHYLQGDECDTTIKSERQKAPAVPSPQCLPWDVCTRQNSHFTPSLNKTRATPRPFRLQVNMARSCRWIIL